MRKIRSTLGLSAIVLLVSGVVCKVLGALFRLPLTNLLGIEGIGIFQLVMSLYAFALVITCGGVTNSLSKLISSARARAETKKVFSYFLRSLVVSQSLAIIIGLVFLIFRRLICAFQGIDALSTYMLFLFLLPLGAALASFRGYFQGHENMLPTAISQVIEQVFKFVIGLLFAYYFSKIGTSEGVFGAFLGIVLSELVSLIYIFCLFLSKKKNLKFAYFKEANRQFDNANLPLTLSASILPLVNAFDALIVVPRLITAGFSNKIATQLFGLQSGIVGAILNFPLIISMAVTTTLLPNVSYLISRGAGGVKIIERGFKILLFLILPTTFGVTAIGKQIFAIFYKGMTTAMLNTAFNLMFYGSFNIVLTAIMQYMIMLLQANGEFRFIMIITFIAGLAKANISFFLCGVPSINIYALVLGNLVLSSGITLAALFRLKQICAFKIQFFDVFLLIFSTFAMFLAVFTFLRCNYFSNFLNLFIAILLGVFIYFVLTIPFSLKILNIKYNNTKKRL